jgi:hypothetical protein
MMKMAKVRGEVIFRRVVERERRRIAMRFMWIPGVRPVKVPAKIPKRIAIVSSKNITFIIYNELYSL